MTPKPYVPFEEGYKPFEVKRNWLGQWRWKVTARNGNILAVSSEGYRNRKDCIAGLIAHYELLNEFSEELWLL